MKSALSATAPKAPNPAKNSRNALFPQLHEYVLTHEVCLGPDFTRVQETRNLFETKGRKRHSMNLHGNLEHFRHVRHANGTEIYFCYIPRLKTVHRFSQKLKEILPPNFTQYRFKATDNPALMPFRAYFPQYAMDAKEKQNRETFASLLNVFYCTSEHLAPRSQPISAASAAATITLSSRQRPASSSSRSPSPLLSSFSPDSTPSPQPQLQYQFPHFIAKLEPGQQGTPNPNLLPSITEILQSLPRVPPTQPPHRLHFPIDFPPLTQSLKNIGF